MRRLGWAALALGLVALGTVLLRPSALQPPHGGAPGGPPRELALGGATAEYNGLVWLAGEKGYFERERLRVTTSLVDTGAAAIDELLAGRLDIALAAEFVFASRAAREPGLVVLGSIATARTLQVAGLRERGIGAPPDLRGKRIGVPLGTSAEYALGNFLLMNDLPGEAVSIVALAPGAMEAGLRDGKVDAVIIWEPNVHRLRRAFGDRLIAFPAQRDRESFWCLITTESKLAGKTQAIESLLRALVAAETAAAVEPQALRAGLLRHSAEDGEFVDYLRPLLRFKVSLEQALLAALDEEGHWLAARGDGPLPDYRARVRAGPMLAVKPAAVTIIGLRSAR